MKKFMMVFLVLAFSGMGASLLALDEQLPGTLGKPQSEINLYIGLQSGNSSVRRSAAMQLGRMQSKDAVIPLMSILHDSGDENVRIVAAWALCAIGDPIGVYAVKRAVEFDKSDKVRLQCAWYYENLVRPGTFMFLEYNPVTSMLFD